MKNTAEMREKFFGEITPCGGGFSIIEGKRVHIDDLTETTAVGLTEDGDWYEAKKSFGILRSALTIALAEEKIYEEEKKISIDERINEFIETHQENEMYTVEHFSEWFRRLTGACLSGRDEFIRREGLKHDDVCTPSFFLNLMIEKKMANKAINRLFEVFKDSEPIYEKINKE